MNVFVIYMSDTCMWTDWPLWLLGKRPANWCSGSGARLLFPLLSLWSDETRQVIWCLALQQDQAPASA